MIRILPLLLLLCAISVFAQDNEETKSGVNVGNRMAFKVEYFGELVMHPGLNVGIDYTVMDTKWITLHWNADLGGYWHRWNNTSAFLKTSFGSRFKLGSAFADFNLGLGYMHSWAAGDLYQRAEDGGVERATNWGHSHFMPNASFLIGWDGTKKTNLPVMIHFGPEIYLQSGFNHTFLPHAAAKLGFTYKFQRS